MTCSFGGSTAVRFGRLIHVHTRVTMPIRLCVVIADDFLYMLRAPGSALILSSNLLSKR